MQLLKLFGQIDILGNPASLIENMESGIKDMLIIPFKALVRSGKIDKFGKMVAEGTVNFIITSFSGKTIHINYLLIFNFNELLGVSSSVTRIISTIFKGLATLTLDEEYLKERQLMKNRTIKRV